MRRIGERIISFDLDMTLLDHKTMEIPQSAMETVERLKQDSIVVLGSGRNMDGYDSRRYRDLVSPHAIIHLNGSKVEADHTVIYEHFMDKNCLFRLLKYAENRGIIVGTSIGEYDYYTHPGRMIEMDKKRWGDRNHIFRNARCLLDLPVHTLTCFGRPEQVRELQQQFKELKFPLFVGGTGADIVELQVSKAVGLKYLCKYYGINPRDTIAFGDSMNDYEVVREAGIGIAMGNAVEELKNAADYVADDIDKDGIWKICRELNLI
ncbi:Cof-type HAD-IIB family hydrolase [Enterocloster lavalensis]|uniref:Cof-type HAD-IIB family hydrolase n=1 Tax=Enterocloster lavalensis TaxID=460384 RepID=UPI0026652419|nr:Cof-type HAD-IIB family hydrolase [Enterocloster lavalensis]